MNVSLECTVHRNAEIMFTDLGDSMVMMDPDKGEYYEFDQVGTRIWTMLDTGRPVAEVCERLAGDYDVTPEVCRRDVLEFLEQVHDLGIVEIRAPAVP